MNKRDRTIILHVLDTADEINEYLKDVEDFETFKSNTMLRRAIAMCMISISEIVSNFSDEFHAEHDSINIRQFKQLRNVAAHNYGAISVSKLYDTVILELPHFVGQLKNLLEC